MGDGRRLFLTANFLINSSKYLGVVFQSTCCCGVEQEEEEVLEASTVAVSEPMHGMQDHFVSPPRRESRALHKCSCPGWLGEWSIVFKAHYTLTRP